ncbi:membrane protein [Mycobacterium heidelbergense]|nr:membrane protein [Mycobacterium heidelbergense]
MRLIGALGALITAIVGGTVGWQGVAPGPGGGGPVELRSTAAPMETTMKSPIVATTDPRPFDACEDIPFDAVQRLGLAFTPPEHEDGLRCHFDAGNYQMAVEPIIWRTYAETLPADAVETTIQGHRAAQYWVLKPTYHNSYWYFSCMVAFKTSYGVIQQSLFFSTVYSNPEVDCMSTNLQRANDLAPYYKF